MDEFQWRTLHAWLFVIGLLLTKKGDNPMVRAQE